MDSSTDEPWPKKTMLPAQKLLLIIYRSVQSQPIGCIHYCIKVGYLANSHTITSIQHKLVVCKYQPHSSVWCIIIISVCFFTCHRAIQIVTVGCWQKLDVVWTQLSPKVALLSKWWIQNFLIPANSRGFLRNFMINISLPLERV